MLFTLFACSLTICNAMLPRTKNNWKLQLANADTYTSDDENKGVMPPSKIDTPPALLSPQKEEETMFNNRKFKGNSKQKAQRNSEKRKHDRRQYFRRRSSEKMSASVGDGTTPRSSSIDWNKDAPRHELDEVVRHSGKDRADSPITSPDSLMASRGSTPSDERYSYGSSFAGTPRYDEDPADYTRSGTSLAAMLHAGYMRPLGDTGGSTEEGVPRPRLFSTAHGHTNAAQSTVSPGQSMFLYATRDTPQSKRTPDSQIAGRRREGVRARRRQLTPHHSSLSDDESSTRDTMKREDGALRRSNSFDEEDFRRLAQGLTYSDTEERTDDDALHPEINLRRNRKVKLTSGSSITNPISKQA